jgi:cytochrome c556
MKKLIKITALCAVGMMIAGGVWAQFATPDDAIAYRKSAMIMIVQHFKRMGAMVQGKVDFDKQAFEANAAAVKTLATLPWEAAMMPGSDKGDTTMSAAVFSKADDFKKTANAFEAATAKLEAVSQSGDVNAIKAQFGAVAQSCKACHSQFRKH